MSKKPRIAPEPPPVLGARWIPLTKEQWTLVDESDYEELNGFNWLFKEGRKAKSAGDNFEKWIDDQHEAAFRLGILAHVEHNQPHSKVVGGRVIYTAQGISDYSGCLEGGRYLAVEAKSTSKDYLERSAVQPKQAAHLEAVARAGGLALLLVEFRPLGYHFAVPWLEVPWQLARTAERVWKDDLAKWWTAGHECYLGYWHPGGPRSSNLGSTSSAPRKRVFSKE